MENKFTPTSRNYTKTNFVELLELITPGVYQEEDGSLSGYGLNPVSDIINAQVRTAANMSDVISVSAVAGSQTAIINTISGIAPYFVKQNDLTNITPYIFEKNILVPLNQSLVNFDNRSEFLDYLSGTLLPKIVLEQETNPGTVRSNMSFLRPLAGVDASAAHNYLLDTLGWFYLLNTSADGGLSYEPSSYVASSLSYLYEGRTLTTLDGIKGLTEYIWRNYETCSVFKNNGLLPADFVSGIGDSILEASAGVTADYTSGIQRLENLNTMLEVLYSPAYMDNEDYRISDALNNYIQASVILNDQVSQGPMRRFMNAMGFEVADRMDEIEQIQLLYDIENCPDGNLQRIADLIGWRLYGNSPSKWRHQLRSAVDIYKRKGTLDAIQYAINALIVNTSFDVSSRVQELYESYLPQLIWYALGTESKHFKDLNTWTPDLAIEAGIHLYSPSSIEDNLKLAVDYILDELYEYFPNSFVFKGEKFPTYDFYTLGLDGNVGDKYTTIYHPNSKPFFMLDPNDPTYDSLFMEAMAVGEAVVWQNATFEGPLGYGTYFAGAFNPDPTYRPTYLSATGDLSFVFNYRGRQNYPLPPFEEVKYYEDCLITAPLVERLVERLKCLGVRSSFADQLSEFLIQSAVTTTDTLGDLNNFLMLFSSTQVPPNFNYVLENIDQYYKNLIPLWNGKSSHLFVDFQSDDFNFAKTTMEGDSRYAVIESARVINEFSPAHAIPVVVVTASALEDYTTSATSFEYLGLDKDDNLASTSGVLGNYEISGAAMSFAGGGGDGDQGSNDGRGGLNTFKRFDSITGDLFSSTAAIITSPRRAHRRRNFKYALPKAGYYDRTGFNGPISFDPSTLEYSFASSLGVHTLGYVASAGAFHPVKDPIDPTGVWHECEGLGSIRTFSGVDTSATFPFRGLYALGSNAKMQEISSDTARYNDRDQLPEIYRVMHKLMQKRAFDYSNENASITSDNQWKNILTSFTNSAIASGLLLNNYSEYENFAFGLGLHRLHKDYAKYFELHPLGLNEVLKTGGNIFAQVYGRGLYNYNFDIDGENIGSFINTGVVAVSSINSDTVFSDAATDSIGTQGVSGAGDIVVPMSGTFIADKVANAEFRNNTILSGVEFTDASGGSRGNSFTIFRLDTSNSTVGDDNALIDNTIIKFKTKSGLPRIRFDLSSVGDRRNYFIKEHKFRLDLSALVAREDSPVLGGGQVGIWIHTDVKDGYIWSWTRSNKWVPTKISDISLDVVKNLSNIFSFSDFDPTENSITTSAYDYCLETYISKNGTEANEISLRNMKKEFFSKISLEFDTRNFSISNNVEYLKHSPYNLQTDDLYSKFGKVHLDDTNYIVEIFFLPNSPDKYMILERANLTDITLREAASIPTGHGLETSGWPLRRFVKEDRLYLDQYELREVLKFYNGLAGLDTKYTSILNSRDATLTSGTLEASGGSRLNYRIHPDWVTNTKQANHNNYELLEIDD
jgi:hypothetical protein